MNKPCSQAYINKFKFIVPEDVERYCLMLDLHGYVQRMLKEILMINYISVR